MYELDSDSSSVGGSVFSHTSCQSFAPFPFPDRPDLPHVDSYIEQDNLKARNLATISHHGENWSRSNIKTSVSRKRPPRIQRLSSNDSSLDLDFDDDDPRNISKLISLCSDGSGYITLKALESMFRKCKRKYYASHQGSHCQLIKYLMGELENYFERINKNPSQWFRTVINSHTSHWEGRITWSEFKFAIKSLCKQAQEVPWSDQNVLLILHYLDPVNNGYISINDFRESFMKYKETFPEVGAYNAASTHIMHLYDLIRRPEKQIRIRDLFRSLDPEHTDRVSISLLTQGLQKLFETSNSQVGSSQLSLRNSSSGRTSSTADNLKLPFLGGTVGTNKMFLERLLETKQKLDDSKYANDSLLSPPIHTQSMQRCKRQNRVQNLPQPAFDIEEATFEIPPLIPRTAKAATKALAKSKGKGGDLSIVSDYEDEEVGDREDLFYSTTNMRRRSMTPSLTPSAAGTLKFPDANKSFSPQPFDKRSSGGSEEWTNSSVKLLDTQTKVPRSLRQHAEIKAMVLKEAKSYDSFVNQFDKRVEIYLNRLSRI
eukprot:gene1485-2854_t